MVMYAGILIRDSKNKCEKAIDWYKHDPEEAIDINTHQVRQPDIVIIDKSKNKFKFIDVTLPEEKRVSRKDSEMPTG